MILVFIELNRRLRIVGGCARCAVQALLGRPMTQRWYARPARPRLDERSENGG